MNATTTAPTDTIGLGHNNPPLITNEQLFADHGQFAARVTELEGKAATQPTFIELGDDASQSALQDLIKEIDKEVKIAEMTREGVKAPFLEACRTADGFWKGLADPKGKRQGRLDIIRDALARVGNDFLRRKDAAARAKLEAEARRRRDEEQRLRDEEAKRNAEAEKLRERGRRTQAAQKEEQGATSGHLANAVAGTAVEAERNANAKPADLARTRSEEGGSLGTLQEFWDMTITDYASLEPDPIWPYIPRAEKEKAIRAYMKANAPKEKTTSPWNPLRGVNFFRSTRGLYR